MSLPEGVRVDYVGEGDFDLEIGDTGKVLASDGAASHVMWLTGAKSGQVMLVDDLDLVAEPNGFTPTVGLVSFSVRAAYDRHGAVGLLNNLEAEGHLSTFGPIVEEAIQMVSQRIHEDPSFVEVLSQLDPDDGDEFVTFATFALLKDAFGGDY